MHVLIAFPLLREPVIVLLKSLCLCSLKIKIFFNLVKFLAILWPFFSGHF